jgi:hypothetical protein
MAWIFTAWPLAGFTWVVFLGERFVANLRILARGPQVASMSGGGIFSPSMAALLLFGVFFSLMAVRVPIAFALGLACLPVIIFEPRLSPDDPVQRDVQVVQLVHPDGGAVLPAHRQPDERRRHHRPAGAAVARPGGAILPGGPGAGQRRCSRSSSPASPGSSTADAASQGKIFIEAQVKEGYDLSFSVAITAVSAVLAVIIPPSILMIVWGGTLSVSIGALFLAGIIPGLLLGFVQMATVHVYAKLRNYPKVPALDLSEVVAAMFVAIPALMTPVIIIGGKIFGWFTATESAAIAVIYAAVLSIFVYRELRGTGLYAALIDTGKLAAVALFCVGTASAFGWLLAYYQIPKALLAGVGAWGMGITQTGFFIAFCFLVVGCFLDAIPAIIIVGTILEPLARRWTWTRCTSR